MSEPAANIDQAIPLARIARQHLETAQLMGVEFVPVRMNCPTDSIDAPNAELDSVQITAESEQTPSAVQVQTPDCSLLASPDSQRAVPRVSGNPASKVRALEDLRARHDTSCPHCTTVTYHTRTVFGEGDPNARIMFVGEAPGEEEDRTGRPFVGRAGQKLNDIIKAMGLAREQVYIANILKSRPPDNRTPLQHEVDACGPFLTEQIRIIQPVAIVALGGPSAKYLLKTETGITRIRGQWGWFEEAELRVPVMPTFHPAFLLRQYTVENRQKVWSDMQAVLTKTSENP